MRKMPSASLSQSTGDWIGWRVSLRKARVPVAMDCYPHPLLAAGWGRLEIRSYGSKHDLGEHHIQSYGPKHDLGAHTYIHAYSHPTRGTRPISHHPRVTADSEVIRPKKQHQQQECSLRTSKTKVKSTWTGTAGDEVTVRSGVGSLCEYIGHLLYKWLNYYVRMSKNVVWAQHHERFPLGFSRRVRSHRAL